jgi:transcriptional activator SPT7
LIELKTHPEHSAPFLQRVNKREAPDYYNSKGTAIALSSIEPPLTRFPLVITRPMDLGSMTKKLKSRTYKSKTEFITDLDLIWNNCLRYTQGSSNPLRRIAHGMRNEAEKLIPLIPDRVI